MESRAHYALIGTFVIVALLAAVAFMAWLSNSQFDQEYDNYEVVFNGPVRGISRGSEVHYNGLKVGEVMRLRWDKSDTNIVIADIQVEEDTPIHVDSPAQLEPQGLTGVNYLQITSGPSEAAFTGRPPFRISGKMSQLDTFLDEGGSIIDGTQSALNRVNATLNEEAITDFHEILSNINTLTGNVKNTKIDGELVERMLLAFEQAAKDVSSAAIAVETAAVEFDSLVGEDVKGFVARGTLSLQEVDNMLADISQFAEGGTALTADSRDAINRLSNSGLTDLEETADGMRRVVLSLSELIEKLERNPTQFIAGEEREVMELPQ